ncbi:MAG: sulfite exporter TauE/SafE family protein [Acidimicrobiales bacterium]
MDGLEVVAVVAAGMGAGFINAVVGSGSLISFPTLLAVGYPSVTANVSNNIGLVPGSVTGAWGFRRELEGQGRRARTLAVASSCGALTGAFLLLRLPETVFDKVVPVLVLLAVGLMIVQPRLSRWVAARRREDARDVGAVALVLVFLAGIYGGYFGAAQGIILLAILGVFVPDNLIRSNAVKNVLAGTVNAVAAVFFIVFAEVAWEAVLAIATGAVVGGWLGAKVGRRIPPVVLRVLVVVIGLFVAVRLLLR